MVFCDFLRLLLDFVEIFVLLVGKDLHVLSAGGNYLIHGHLVGIDLQLLELLVLILGIVERLTGLSVVFVSVFA